MHGLGLQGDGAETSGTLDAECPLYSFVQTFPLDLLGLRNPSSQIPVFL